MALDSPSPLEPAGSARGGDDVRDVHDGRLAGRGHQVVHEGARQTLPVVIVLQLLEQGAQAVESAA